MESDQFIQNAHLFLGITREELKRRLSTRELDPQILKSQIDHHCQEIRLEALCEKWLDTRALAQIDKFSAED